MTGALRKAVHSPLVDIQLNLAAHQRGRPRQTASVNCVLVRNDG
jgi:hypothetical protein